MPTYCRLSAGCLESLRVDDLPHLGRTLANVLRKKGKIRTRAVGISDEYIS